MFIQTIKEEKMEEVKRLLKEINDTLKYQTKLFESMFNMADANKFKMEQQKESVEKLKGMIMNNPLVKNNPEAADLMNQAFSIGGK